MTTIITAHDTADFLALVPRLAGYHPSASLVLVLFDGTRTGRALRIDLPAPDADVAEFASQVVGLICRVEGCDGVAAVVYSDEPVTPAHESLIVAVERRLDAAGFTVRDLLWVGTRRWGRYLDGSGSAGLGDRLDLESERAWSSRVPDPVQSQAAAVLLPPVRGEHRDAVATALAGIGEAISALGASRAARVVEHPGDDPSSTGGYGYSVLLAALERLEDLPASFDAWLWRAPAELTAEECAVLAWALARPALRDIALATWCDGIRAGARAMDAQLRWEDGEEYPVELAARMWGAGAQPAPERLHRALELARWVAASAPEDARAGALSACAWLSWARGASTRAGQFAAAAQAIEPAHGMAQIILEMVNRGHLPEWAFQAAQGGGRIM